MSQQKAALSEYAQEQGLTNIRIYSDYGFSAYDETHPTFVKPETDIRSGKVAALVLFDLTRLSRDYIITSEWIEVFLPRHHVGLYSI
ncbi:recombinase family protein [Oscillospiraceae bacterium 50-60]